MTPEEFFCWAVACLPWALLVLGCWVSFLGLVRYTVGTWKVLRPAPKPYPRSAWMDEA